MIINGERVYAVHCPKCDKGVYEVKETGKLHNRIMGGVGGEHECKT